MNAKLNKGQLTIDISELLDSLSDEDKIELIETLACQDAIIKHVADQILTGWTENCYSGGTSYAVEGHAPLDLARKRVIELAPEVAREEIERLKRFAKNQEEDAKKYMDKYFKLYHDWPRDSFHLMPKFN
jgi:hypothetical protein